MDLTLAWQSLWARRPPYRYLPFRKLQALATARQRRMLQSLGEDLPTARYCRPPIGSHPANAATLVNDRVIANKVRAIPLWHDASRGFLTQGPGKY